MTHVPVLQKEVLQYLAPKPGENVIDGTVGGGGHAQFILEKNGPDGRLLGIDWDLGQIKNSKLALQKYTDRILLIQDSCANIKNIVEKENFTPVHGILLDLGYSSWQLEQSEKGFSFQKNEPLDMRYGGDELTAEKIINEYSELGIQKILEEYGEEKFAKQIAREIGRERKRKKIEMTFELVAVIEKAVPEKFKHGKIHCATRTFQALRIEVNHELENLKKVLPDAVSVLAPGGRLVVISFHSLEDRIVKDFFRQGSKTGTIKIMTKKPITAAEEEIAVNPRSRSAKLRAITKI